MRAMQIIVTWFLLVFLMGVNVSAEVPSLINYQGNLTDVAGNGVDTITDLTFTIFEDTSATTALWTEIHHDVLVTNGLFSVLLGGVSPFAQDFWNEPNRYLGIQVDGGAMSDPLLQMTSVAFAQSSKRADRADRADTADFAVFAAESDTADYARSGPGSAAAGCDEPRCLARAGRRRDAGPRSPRPRRGPPPAGRRPAGRSNAQATPAGDHGGPDQAVIAPLRPAAATERPPAAASARALLRSEASARSLTPGHDLASCRLPGTVTSGDCPRRCRHPVHPVMPSAVQKAEAAGVFPAACLPSARGPL